MLRTLDLIVSPDVRSILAKIAKCTSFATIAGGYLRDQYYRVPHKDLDIFTGDIGIDKLRAAFPDWVIEDNTGANDDDEGYDKNLGSFGLINMVRDGITPVQIMYSEDYKSVSDVLDRFDFGICQIAYDGSNVLVTEAFWKDAANNTATFVLKEMTPRIKAHSIRLAEKYPNIKWV